MDDYLARIRRDVPLSPRLARAFATVRRELFVPDGFRRRDGTRVAPTDPNFLTEVYADDALITKMSGETATSSSSQPSLMAVMLGALDLHPGVRVLEIGAGTGYHAALMSSLGAVVTTIDVQPDVAAGARAALGRAGFPEVRVECADGYHAVTGPFDRVVVTVGVAGLSPHWFGRLTPDGFVIAPVEHAGTHPVLKVHGRRARVICPAGFMSAAGPLTALHRHPAPFKPPADLLEAAPPRFSPPLDSASYRDLWYAAGVWSPAATRAENQLALRPPAPAPTPTPTPTPTAPVPAPVAADPGAAEFRAAVGIVVVSPDGSIRAEGRRVDDVSVQVADPALLGDAASLITRWQSAARPSMRDWTIELALDGDPATPIWTPHTWTLTP
ncbi:methyltransferase domain-containing protein [Actinoplanes sp. NPDC051851]|uniref:protein-L-isoaspartate O-methyltransferase family protein n=1 Tax=Actinoplanes sp. NPDC051851 TaxID=3154753 RepID=UPI00344A73B4